MIINGFIFSEKRKDGQMHCENGPALECTDGTKYWYLNGNHYTFEEWLEKLNISDEEKVFLRLKYND